MYSANELKQDVLANIKNNPQFNMEIYSVLTYCEFQFNDSGEFTRIKWNTYKRDLVIFCGADDREKLEQCKNALFQLCDKIHGEQEEFLLVSLEIIARSSLSGNRLTTQVINITKNIVIDRTSNEIGKGGFGKIYKYYDEESEEMYAFKIYEPNVFQTSDSIIMKKRFIREGKKLLHYSHENVVKAHEFGFLGDESAFIKLEYISGMKLIDFLNCNVLNRETKEKLCMEYISAMAYVHSKSDMHRDISYSNVMVDSNEEIKVLDFGFARGSNDTRYDTYYKDIEHKFAIPSEEYTFRTEVYCIGAILFSIIVNGVFDKSNLLEINDVDSNPKLINAILICLQDNPDSRFSDAIELKRYLISEEIVDSDVPKMMKEFSLDSFKQLLHRGVRMRFSLGELPTLEVVKKWIEEDWLELIETHTFLSEINLIILLNRLPDLECIDKLVASEYDFTKSTFTEIYNFYVNLKDRIKEIFLRNILTIILECSDDAELPFSKIDFDIQQL